MEVEAPPPPLPAPPPPSLTTTSSEVPALTLASVSVSVSASAPAHAIINCTECRRLCIVLLDGSARTRLYKTTLTDIILPAIFRLGSGSGGGTGRSDSSSASSTIATHYVILAYGDYPPASPAPVLTIYTGSQAGEAQAAIRAWPFHGGAPIRNALHEGLAAALEWADRVRGGDGKEAVTGRSHLGGTTWTQGALLVILSCSMIYEDFHAHALARFHYGALGAEELVRELHRRSMAIQYYCPLISLAGTFVGILERVYQAREGGSAGPATNTNATGGEVIDRQVPGLPPSWIVRIALPEGMTRSAAMASGPSLSSSSSSSATVSTAMMGSGEAILPPTTTTTTMAATANISAPPVSTLTALEAAVRQFLGSVLKMPPGQRADAIKQNLESPAYSAEYKQCLLTMVKQMQQTASASASASASALPMGSLLQRPLPMTQSQLLPPSKGNGHGTGADHPSLGASLPLTPTRPSSTSAIVTGRSTIWTGRLAFKHSNIESYFDLAACPIANPKSSLPHSIPPVAEYHVEAWPLVLAISSFVSIQSAAVVASVPISRLVELVPWAKEAATATANADIASGFRSMLYAKQLVGLVRLGGGQQAMLIAARPHQLVGMVISRQEAVRDGPIVAGTATGMSTTAATAMAMAASHMATNGGGGGGGGGPLSSSPSPSSSSSGPMGGGGGASSARPLPRYNLRSSTPVATTGRSTSTATAMGTILSGTRVSTASGSSHILASSVYHQQQQQQPQHHQHVGLSGPPGLAPVQTPVPTPAAGTNSQPSLILTPEEILRQHRPGAASVPPEGSTSSSAAAAAAAAAVAATFMERPVAMEDVFTALSAGDSIGAFDQLTMDDLTNSPTKPRAGSQDPLFFDGPY